MMTKILTGALLGATLLVGATGCSSNQVRYLTATRWTQTPGTNQRAYYVTYYEGTCSNGVMGFGKGCKEGDSKVRRCVLQADNTMACADEAEANKALSKTN